MITTCTDCGSLYEAGSEEQANGPRVGVSLAGADVASIAPRQRALLMLDRKTTKRSMTRSDADGDD